MGEKSFICCYGLLKGDKRKYKGYPDGIPDGLPFGAFLGRQAKHFCADLGFDYLWLSNGFGFGMETWKLQGALYDGEKFYPEQAGSVWDHIVEFWQTFRQECPDLPLEVRGTNLSTGMDLASDGVPLREIYKMEPNTPPAVNSPWASLTKDFGMELAGWLSHIAELPGKSFPFRYYIHDPWFLNSPWLDRYMRSPHDIFLPLSLSRLDGEGQVGLPDSFAMLTCDDSYGKMPEQVPNEVIPHLLHMMDKKPDRPGPFVWLYPFDEYHEMLTTLDGIREVFFGDWYMRSAINAGLPISSVVSTGNFPTAAKKLTDCIILAPTAALQRPAVADAVDAFLKQGGQVMLYGPVRDQRIASLVGVDLAEGLEGEFTTHAGKILFTPDYCGGAFAEALRPGMDVEPLYTAVQGQAKRCLSTMRQTSAWNDGKLIWIRGGNSFVPGSTRPPQMLPTLLPRNQYFHMEDIPVEALRRFGWDLRGTRGAAVMTARRHKNAYFLSAHLRDLTYDWQNRQHGVSLADFGQEEIERFELSLPLGAPLAVNSHVVVENGRARYLLPSAADYEFRVFVNQEDGRLSCIEHFCMVPEFQRRIRVEGLKNATVSFLPEPSFEDRTEFVLGTHYYDSNTKGTLRPEKIGGVLVCRHVTGELMISW